MQEGAEREIIDCRYLYCVVPGRTKVEASVLWVAYMLGVGTVGGSDNIDLNAYFSCLEEERNGGGREN